MAGEGSVGDGLVLESVLELYRKVCMHPLAVEGGIPEGVVAYEYHNPGYLHTGDQPRHQKPH